MWNNFNWHSSLLFWMVLALPTTYRTHRRCHVNTILALIQECKYFAMWRKYTKRFISPVEHYVAPSTGSGGGSLQHEGAKVENQSEEMVKHILRKKRKERGENSLEINTNGVKSFMWITWKELFFVVWLLNIRKIQWFGNNEWASS